MAELKDVIEGWKDDGGVRHYSNTDAPAGVQVEQRFEAPRQEPGQREAEDVRRVVTEALDYDVAGKAMSELERHKDKVMRHTFGGRINDERQMDARQQALFRKNLNHVYTQLRNQHQDRREAMLKKAKMAEEFRQEARADKKAAENVDVKTMLRQTAEQLMGLKKQMADTDPARAAAAKEQYKQTYEQARLLQAFAGMGAKPMTADDLEMGLAVGEQQWKEMTPEQQKAEEGGKAGYTKKVLREMEKILSGQSLLGQMGLEALEEEAKGGTGSGGQDAVKQRLVAAAEVIKALPAASQRQAAERIDAAAAKAKQTGDATELVAVLDEIAAAGQGTKETQETQGENKGLEQYLIGQQPQWTAQKAQGAPAPAGGPAPLNLAEVIAHRPAYMRSR